VRWLDRAGWYEPRVAPIASTTRQAEALNLALASPPTSHRGLIVGCDRLSGQVVCWDPFVAYEDRLIESPLVAVIGDLGQGKSSLLKTWGCVRQLVLGRRVVVLDKKLQGGEGEYSRLARWVGAPSIKFTVDPRVQGSRLNLLDPVISLGQDQPDDDTTPAGLARPTGQMMLLRAVLAEALGRPVTEIEGKALRLALVAATRDAHRRHRVPVIADVVHHLQHPDPEDAEALRRSPGELADWGRDPGFALERMIEEDLAGLVDAPTSPDVRLDHPSGLVHFDLSALPEEGPALRIVMTAINTWQSNVLAQRSRHREQTVNIVEEGWHVAEGSIGAIFRRNAKLARGLGLSILFGIHHISDLAVDSPARALLQEAATVFIYAQSRLPDAEDCQQLFNLPPGTAEVITTLAQGVCLLKPGREDPLLVEHIRSPREVAVTETDAALVGRPR
jgi:hypothetical protein